MPADVEDHCLSRFETSAPVAGASSDKRTAQLDGRDTAARIQYVCLPQMTVMYSAVRICRIDELILSVVQSCLVSPLIQMRKAGGITQFCQSDGRKFIYQNLVGGFISTGRVWDDISAVKSSPFAVGCVGYAGCGIGWIVSGIIFP